MNKEIFVEAEVDVIDISNNIICASQACSGDDMTAELSL